MKLNEAREQAARCLNAANEIRKRYKAEEEWNKEDQENFDKAISDFKEANNEAVRLQTQEDNFNLIDNAAEDYLKPRNAVRNPGSEGNQTTVGESFARYRKLARFNFKAERVMVKGMDNDMVDRCLEIHHEAFMAYLRGDTAGLIQYTQRQKHVAPSEIHALTSEDDTKGGFLVPEDMRSEIIKADAGAAVLANLVRSENTNRDTLTWPKITPHSSDNRRTSGFGGTWRKKASITTSDVQDQPTFARERIAIHDWTPDAVEVETNLLDDSGANVEAIIGQAIGEALAFDKDDAILTGSGAGEPEGVLNCGASNIASQGATSVEYGGIIGMYVGVPQQYRRNGTWVMHSWSMGAILQLNTGTGGVYLFPPNQWNNTILGRPVVFCDSDDMPKPTAEGGTTFTALEKPIIFGDWKRFILAMRQDLRVQRLVETFYPNIGIAPSARMGGQVVLTDAFRLMQIRAS